MLFRSLQAIANGLQRMSARFEFADHSAMLQEEPARAFVDIQVLREERLHVGGFDPLREDASRTSPTSAIGSDRHRDDRCNWSLNARPGASAERGTTHATELRISRPSLATMHDARWSHVELSMEGKSG